MVTKEISGQRGMRTGQSNRSVQYTAIVGREERERAGERREGRQHPTYLNVASIEKQRPELLSGRSIGCQSTPLAQMFGSWVESKQGHCGMGRAGHQCCMSN